MIVAITFGSSAAFAMPIGYQTSLMIYGPGGYRFKDFIRMGVTLDLLAPTLALWLIPKFWPLTAPSAIILNGSSGSNQTDVERNRSVPLPITHLRAGGVNSVVTMTTITTTLKVTAS